VNTNLKNLNSFPHIYIVDASAGSGKTYNLALRYLTLVLSSEISSNIKEILAITFTNKAAKEMKMRILLWLKKITLDELEGEEKKILQNSIGEDLLRIKERAYQVLEGIINNYDYFQVKTIDSFMNIIVNASSFYLELSPYFKIEEEYSPYLEKALDELIRRVGYDKNLKKIFKEFLLHYLEIENQTNWFPKKNILRLFSTLFKHSNLRGKNFSKFWKDKELKEIAQEIKKYLENFSYMKLPSRLYNAILKAKEEQPLKALSRLANYLNKESNKLSEDENFCYQWKKFKEKAKLFCEGFSLSRFNPYIEIFSQFLTTFERLKKEEDILFLEELNKKVKEITQTLSYPYYVYQYLALKFTHYLIDEFQDTNRIQWENLKPLIEEALSCGGSLFYVGDKKQAIYRFRAADVRIFNDVKREFEKKVKIMEDNLSCNFRSQKEIVEFNNEIFSLSNLNRFLKKIEKISPRGISLILENFKESQQKFLPQNNKGYVFIQLIEGKTSQEREELTKKKIESLLEELKKRYPLHKIAILLRDNKQVKKITSWLIEKNIPVESEKTLDIRENYLIKEIISFLKFLSSPIDNLSFASFILGDIFTKLAHLKKEIFEDFVFQNIDKGYLYRIFREKFPSLWSDFFEEFFKKVGFLPLYEFLTSILEKLDVFKNFPQAESFFIKLLQLVHEKEKEEILTLQEFLEYFENSQKAEDFFVPVVEEVEAVKVLTIHKAKGLEFKVVILPFFAILPAQGRGHNYIVVEREKDLNLVYLKKDFTFLSSQLKDIYEKEYISSLIDELNISYVALTRAIEELYVFIPERVGIYKNLAKELICKRKKEERGKKQFFFQRKSFPVQYVFSSSHKEWCDYLEEEFPTPGNLKNREILKKGEIFHLLLSFIEKIEESNLHSTIEEILNKCSYLLSFYDREKLKEKLLKILKAPELKKIFYLPKEAKVYNETELIDEKGQIKRPDKIIELENEVWVVDYKTFYQNIELYKQQLEEYKKLTQEIFSKKTKGFLVYLDSLSVQEV